MAEHNSSGGGKNHSTLCRNPASACIQYVDPKSGKNEVMRVLVPRKGRPEPTLDSNKRTSHMSVVSVGLFESQYDQSMNRRARLRGAVAQLVVQSIQDIHCGSERHESIMASIPAAQ